MIKQWYRKYCLKKYYLSIKELPVKNWDDILQTGTLKPLLKRGRLDRYGAIAYQILQDQLIECFGISPDFMKVLKNKIRIALYKSEIMETGDRTRLIFIERLEQQNTELESRAGGGDLYEAIFQIQKHLPYKIDLKTYTVWEFYSDSKNLKRMLKAA